jgi:hypothetical protein
VRVYINLIVPSILYLVDPSTFASLVLLNKKWREASETPNLYAHHLSRCPSYSLTHNVISGPFTTNDLPRLRRRFAVEAKRNLFEVYLRPRQTFINLISMSTSSSAAFPRGEAFHFIFSANGRTLLALSSARIFVVDVSSDPVQVKRELKPLRRPISAAILDDGSLLAVLSSKHEANLYRLDGPGVDHVKKLSFDNPPRTIALSPEGAVLAAAYDGGIEVYSLAENALTTDRRAVRCDAVDVLTFSDDSTTLLGTVANIQDPNLVVVTAPYYGENGIEVNPKDVQSRMWTSQMLFPNSNRRSSFANFLSSHHEGDGTWVFVFDSSLGCFRAIQMENTSNGVTYFLGPKAFSRHNRELPSAVPSTDPKGNLVATVFSGNGVWLFGVPERIDFAPDWSHVDSSGREESVGWSSTVRQQNWHALARDYMTEDETTTGLPREWQKIVDGQRHFFVEGHQILDIPGVTSIQWAARGSSREELLSANERLVVVAPGGVSGSDGEEDVPVDGGRIIIVDFERSTQNGEKTTITIEVGEIEPEPLPEETQNIESEVAIVRRRTLRQNPGGLGSSRRVSLARTQTAVGTASSLLPSLDIRESNRVSSTSPSSPTETPTIDELHEVFDAPYSHTQPRSRNTLHRAATAVAANRQRNPRVLASGHVVYRRADGTRELPHESDADNWEPPPPPYTPDADEPLPEHLRLTLLPRHTEPVQRVTRAPQQPVRASTRFDSFPSSAFESALQRTRSTIERVGTLTRRDRSDQDESRGDIQPSGPADPGITSSQRPVNRTRRSSSGDNVRPPSAALFDQNIAIRRRPVSSQPTGSATHPLAEEFPPLSASRSSPVQRGSAPPEILLLPTGPTLTSPISPIPESAIPEGRPTSLSADTRIEPSTLLSSSPQSDRRVLTLSGSNLQNRLDYPVPPTPQGEVSRVDMAPSLPPSRESSSRLATADRPASSSYALPQPTASQLDTLQRKYSQGSRSGRPSPISTSHTRRSSGNCTVPPSPPRAAMGAVGPPSPSFQNMHLSPSRSISRSNSRGSTRSFSASTPNLQRPNYRRLDTIQSITSGHEVPHRSRSRSQDAGARISRIEGQEIDLTMRDDRRVVTDPSSLRAMGKRRKGEIGAGRPDGDGRQQVYGDANMESDKGKKKGFKCIVM